jgi:hypothetical protein
LLHSAHDTWSQIIGLADVLEPQARSRREFIEECKSGAFDGVLVAYRTFDSYDITGRIDEEVVAVLPQSLKFICHNGRLCSCFWLCVLRFAAREKREWRSDYPSYGDNILLGMFSALPLLFSSISIRKLFPDDGGYQWGFSTTY